MKYAIIALVLSFAFYAQQTNTKLVELEKRITPVFWAQNMSETYKNNGRVGEKIITLNGSDCVVHRIRWRGVYFMANTCGGIYPEAIGSLEK